MNHLISSTPSLFDNFIFVSAFYAVPVALLFLLLKGLSSENPSPYSWKSLWWLCLPGFLYALLDSVAERQGLNILVTVPVMVIAGIIATFLLRRINLTAWVFVSSALALLLWWLVPNSYLKIM